MFSDDPVRDAERYFADQDRELERFPTCNYCGDLIQDEKLFDFDGDLYHISCIVEQYRKDTEDYME